MLNVTQEDLDFLFTDVSHIEDLSDDEILSMMGTHQYKDGYKMGLKLAEEYRKRFLNSFDEMI